MTIFSFINIHFLTFNIVAQLNLNVATCLKLESITMFILAPLILQEKDHRQASSKVVGQNFRHKFDGASSSYKPVDIRQDFQKEFGDEISYHKAFAM